MKKIGKWILITTGILVLVCILSCVLPYIIPVNPIRIASSMLKVELPKGTTPVTSDDMPGLPIPGGASDGYTFLILQIPPEEITEFTGTLERSPFWQPLPLPAEIAKQEWLLQPSFDIKEEIPIATSTGYYLFRDYQDEYNQRKGEQIYDTETPFYERHSFNFVFGLFNDKDGKLYLWELNT